MSQQTIDLSAQVQAIVAYFEGLSGHSLTRLGDFYEPHARFKDPFNEVTGVAAIQAIFARMFDTLVQPRFVVTAQVLQGQQCFLTWEFRFYFKSFQRGQAQVIRGASHLVLSDAGRVTLHRDYWDAAEELYEKLPLIGRLMRWLKGRVG